MMYYNGTPIPETVVGGKRKTSYFSDVISFDEEALEMIAEEKIDDEIVNAFHDNGFCKFDKTGRYSLSSKDYVKRSIPISRSAIFIKRGGKYHLLWKAEAFYLEQSAKFLSKSFVEKSLKKFFRTVEVSLGLLSTSRGDYISWKAQTEDDVFFIPFHCGALLKEQEGFSFVEKPFEDMRKTYYILKFGMQGEGEFRSLCR